MKSKNQVLKNIPPSWKWALCKTANKIVILAYKSKKVILYYILVKSNNQVLRNITSPPLLKVGPSAGQPIRK